MFFLRGLESPRFFFEEDGKGGGNPNHDKHLEQVISERDNAKAREREALEKATTLQKQVEELQGKFQAQEDETKIKNGEALKLAEERLKTIETQKAEIERLKEKETELNTYIETRRKSLLEKIPEDHRPKWEKSELTILENVVPLFEGGGQTLDTDNGKNGKQIDTKNKKWDDLSIDELDKLAESNKDEYNRLYKEKYGR